jgi:IS5 family transposase
MRPPTPKLQSPDDPQRVRLAVLLSHEHPLYQLAEAIDWARFESEFGSLYAEDVGRPGLPMRLMVGLHYLKYLFDESDETVVEKFIENPYWQFFCGRTSLSTNCPVIRLRSSSGAAASGRRGWRSC